MELLHARTGPSTREAIEEPNPDSVFAVQRSDPLPPPPTLIFPHIRIRRRIGRNGRHAKPEGDMRCSLKITHVSHRAQ